MTLSKHKKNFISTLRPAGWLPAAFLTFGLLFLPCTASWAATYYVDAQNGDDNNNGLATTPSGRNTGPWKSISKVNNTIFSPGDSILFRRGGVWTDGPLQPQNGGAPGGAITIQESVVGQALSFELVDPSNNNCVYFGAYGPGTEKPKIDCQGGRGIVIEHNYIIVEGLHVDNGDNNVLWLNRSEGTRWVNIFDVDVTRSNANAVRSNEGGSNIWLKGLYVYDYGVNGILLSGSPNNLLKHVLVEDCWVENPVTQDLEDAITCHRGENTHDLEGYIIIRNNTIRRAGEDGIDVTSGTHILLDGNDIRYSFSAGILISKAWVNTIEARNNFLFSNSFDQGNGDLSIRVHNVWAYNNVIAGNGHNCLSMSDIDNAKIWNNIIAPMNRTGDLIRFTENVGSVELKNNIFDFTFVDQEIHIETPGPNIVFDHNCYYGTSPGQEVCQNLSFQQYRDANPLFEPNGFWANPEFVSPGRTSPDFFRLAATSPCIDRGALVPVPTDFWGAPRPQGPLPDIGIFEQSALDCDPDPNITLFSGDACDDGDPTTIDDVIDANCNCAGTPTACTGIGDADGDGACSNTDCDDNDPSVAYQPGDTCDDGNPNTTGETIQSDCSCNGGVPLAQTTLTCAAINDSNDDAEEHSSGYVSLNSSDLEMAVDPGRGNQVIGLRFNGLNIPQGATIVSARIQFTAEDDENGNPCNLFITGQAGDNPGSFLASYQNVSTRPRTGAGVHWTPAEWQSAGNAGAAQQTPGLSAILQEIVNRSGYSSNSSIVLFIEGTGRRVAESYDGSSELAPELCVEYATSAMSFDCPALQANIGSLCNDGNPNTINDAIDANCNCIGTPVLCPGSGDADGDGVCADTDCDDNDPNITHQPGDACNDGDATTTNDAYDNNCNCTGTPAGCAGIGDNDNDGVCANLDCDDNDPSVTSQPGDTCDDGDNTTINDKLGANCNCAGTPTACTGIGDGDGDGICADADCDDNDPNITSQPGDACDDGDNTTTNDRLDSNCNCIGTPTPCTGTGDRDGDGICADVDCNDLNPAITSQPGDACNDGNPNTINDIIDANCNCVGAPVSCPGVGDADGDGVCADTDCDDNDPNVSLQPGDACNDGNPLTFGETIQADCSCGGGSTGTAPILTCSQINNVRDDAEEQSAGQIRLASNDLELAYDPNSGNQLIGLRFTGLDIPRNAYIVSARIQFTAESNSNGNPADLTIYGEASNNPGSFRGAAYDISSRPRTNAEARWMPSEWAPAGAAGLAQRTPGLSPVIQEIVNRNGFSSNSAVVLIIEGTGRRSAESFEGFASRAPQLCVEYLSSPPGFDCPSLSGNYGAPCDDRNPNTFNDLIDAHCNCTGTPSICPGVGEPCDDGDPGTIGETIQLDCSCGGGVPSPAFSCARVNNSADDAMEKGSGEINLANSRIELANGNGGHIAGLRFAGLGIPRGSRILKASIQFTAEDAQNSGFSRLRAYGEASDNAGSFANIPHNISNRPTTNAIVEWMPAAWPSAGEAGYAQQSPDLSPILQEIVNRSGYTSASSVAILIDGIGRRSAKAFDGTTFQAPELCIEYIAPVNARPGSNGGPAGIEERTGQENSLPATAAPNRRLLGALSVYPNPATDRLVLAFESMAGGPARIQAVSMSGKVLLLEEREIRKGRNEISLEGLSLPDGLYALQLIAGKSVQSAKFAIMKE